MMINFSKFKKGSANRSIRNKLMAAFIGLAVGPLVLLALVFGFYKFAEFKTTALDKGNSISFLVANEISNNINNFESILNVAISMQDFARLDQIGKRYMFQQLMSKHPHYKEISFVGPQGKEMVRVIKGEVTHSTNLRNLSATEAIIATQDALDSYFGPVRFDDTNGQPLMTLGLPLRDLQSNEYQGALITELRLKPIWSLIASFNKNLNMNIYILDERNRVIAHANPAIVLRGTQLEKAPATGIQRGFGGQKSFITSHEFVLGQRRFLVVTEQNVLLALIPSTLDILIFCAVILVALSSAGGLMMFIIQHFVDPVRAVSKSAIRIAEGNLSERLALLRKDEIGDLANAFDHMAEKIEKSHNRLEQQVRIRTKELAEKVVELDYQKEEADKANRAKSQFLSSMSHELRTPLNAILGFAQLLEMDEKDDKKRKNILEVINGGNHLLTLINQMLDLVKIESSNVELSIENHSVHKILNDSLSMLKPLADKHAIQIDDKVSSLPDINISVDDMRFKQVLLNILSNAIKYNSEKGKVTIDCSSNDKNMFCLSVTDTGKGFTADQQSHLFEPFERFEAANSNIEGTGLGLIISKELIELMGGTITVESEVGKGSNFVIHIPLS